MKLSTTSNIGWTGIKKQLGNAWLVEVDQQFLRRLAMRMRPQVPQMLEAVLPQQQTPLRVLLNRNTQRVANKMSQAGASSRLSF